MTRLSYDGRMSQLQNLYKRLAKIENLTIFCRVHKLNYRTIQRLRAHGVPTVDTLDKVTKALDKEGTK